MDKKYKSILGDLGYNTSLEGFDYFLELVEFTSQILEVFDDEDKARKLIPCCCLDCAHFDYEVGLIRFKEELDKFVNSRKIRSYNRENNIQVYGDCKKMSTEDTIINFSKYVISDKENAIDKPLVKYSFG